MTRQVEARSAAALHAPDAATARNMPASRYGVAPVRTVAIVDEFAHEPRAVERTVWYTAIDLLGQGMNPRPLYSERRHMDSLGPTRLGIYLVLRHIYFRLPDRIAGTRLVRRLWRLNRR